MLLCHGPCSFRGANLSLIPSLSLSGPGGAVAESAARSDVEGAGGLAGGEFSLVEDGGGAKSQERQEDEEENRLVQGLGWPSPSSAEVRINPWSRGN